MTLPTTLLALIASPAEPLRRLLHALPGDDVKVNFDTTWLEQNIKLLYPVLGVGTLALVGWAIWSMARTQQMSAEVRADYRRQIVGVLRQFPVGVSAEKIGQRLQLPTIKAAQLLEDMKEDNLVVRDESRQPIIWRLKGIVD